MIKCYKNIFLLMIFIVISIMQLQASVYSNVIEVSGINVAEISQSDSVIIIKSPSSVKVIDLKDQKNKKIISAILAFPFPFGFMGAHRVMLGCKPWVPVFYVATFGGCFGLLPMIDFCAIVFSKNIEQYENNPKVFMWVK